MNRVRGSKGQAEEVRRREWKKERNEEDEK